MNLVGQSLGRYRIDAPLGAGGMGVVYRAHDSLLERPVAIKLLKTPGGADRVLREARSASALNHPNICTVHEVGEHDGTPFIVMEFVEGRPLSESIGRNGLPVDTVVRYGRQIADALAHAHGRGVVHRDLKCANVIVSPEGHLTILDFGIATRATTAESGDAAETRTAAGVGAFAGTLDYMAPELLRGEPADERSEMWAAGVMLFEMVSGFRPFTGDTPLALVAAILEHRVQPVPERAGAGLGAVITRCLARARDGRYAGARELAAALTVAAASLRASTRQTGTAEGAPGLARAHQIQSIVVLPLANRCAAPDQDFFVDGMTDALITELARIRTLRVISRTSAMRYQKTDKTLPEIARELQVDGVIEGSIIRAGDSVRVHAQLVDALEDRSLWTGTYDRDAKDVLALHRELARVIAGEVHANLTSPEQVRTEGPRSVNAAAHALYLKGRYFLNKTVWTPADYEQALTCFTQAAEADPAYAMAYSGQADTYNRLGGYGFWRPTEAFALAKTAALRAVQLDDRLGEAHISLGFSISLLDWDPAGSQIEYERGVALNPAHESGHVLFAACLALQGQYEDAVRRCQVALATSPFYSDGHWTLGMIYRLGGWPDRAVEHLQAWLGIEPHDVQATFQLGLTYADQERYDEAEALLGGMAAHPMLKPLALGPLAYVQGRRGDGEAGARSLAELQAIAAVAPVAPGWIAHAHVGLGDSDAALDWLEKARDYHDSWNMLPLHAERRWEPIRNHPRFLRLLADRDRARERAI